MPDLTLRLSVSILLVQNSVPLIHDEMFREVGNAAA